MKGVYPRTAKHNLINSLSKKGQIGIKGEENSNAILTERQVLEIREMHGRGLASIGFIGKDI